MEQKGNQENSPEFLKIDINRKLHEECQLPPERDFIEDWFPGNDFQRR